MRKSLIMTRLNIFKFLTLRIKILTKSIIFTVDLHIFFSDSLQLHKQRVILILLNLKLHFLVFTLNAFLILFLLNSNYLKFQLVLFLVKLIFLNSHFVLKASHLLVPRCELLLHILELDFARL